MATYPANGSNINTWDAALKTWLTETVFADDGTFNLSARTSLGVGEGDSPTLTGLSLSGLSAGLLHADDSGNILSGDMYVAEYGALVIGD